MSADSKTQLADLLRAALLSVAPDQAETPINLDRPKQAGHGDFASNLALQLAKPLKRNPRELANLLLAVVVAVRWAKDDERAARRRDRRIETRGDVELDDYNAMLAKLAERDR